MAYRNKTFVSFASEDIRSYRLMEAWRSNRNIEFDFHDAHDLNTARDTSDAETIRRRLRERLAARSRSYFSSATPQGRWLAGPRDSSTTR